MERLPEIDSSVPKKSKSFIKGIKRNILAAGIAAIGIATAGCGESQEDVDKKPVSTDKKVESIIKKTAEVVLGYHEKEGDCSGLERLPDEVLAGATDKQLGKWRKNIEEYEKNAEENRDYSKLGKISDEDATSKELKEREEIIEKYEEDEEKKKI
ncbi:hypothetical protein KKG80_01840, partial [Patescibacteria group bacterium]|nr:hypothetical protein [Patescibacteria group bacterium]